MSLLFKYIKKHWVFRVLDISSVLTTCSVYTCVLFLKSLMLFFLILCVRKKFPLLRTKNSIPKLTFVFLFCMYNYKIVLHTRVFLTVKTGSIITASANHFTPSNALYMHVVTLWKGKILKIWAVFTPSGSFRWKLNPASYIGKSIHFLNPLIKRGIS